MIKTTIGELKLFPIKEDGKFVFHNDFITINGKVSKGDSIRIFVDSYQPANDDYLINGKPSAQLVIRGQQHNYSPPDDETFATIRDFYQHVSEVYKNKFYFG